MSPHDRMLHTLRLVYASHCLAVRMEQPGLGALLSHRVREAIEAGEQNSPIRRTNDAQLLPQSER